MLGKSEKDQSFSAVDKADEDHLTSIVCVFIGLLFNKMQCANDGYRRRNVLCLPQNEFFRGPAKTFLKGKTSSKGNVKLVCFLDPLLYFDPKQLFHNI
jgi:hypothetical protein